MKSLYSELYKKIKKVNRSIDGIGILRRSVIIDWLRNHNIRKCQYMAGHRYIRSIEKYKAEDIDALKKKVLAYHPLDLL